MGRDVFSRDAAPCDGQGETAKPSPKTGEGAVCARWVRCGKANCRCMHGGPKHGPYYARYWWRDGRRHKRYVRQRDAADVVAACSARREAERDGRERAEQARRVWRGVRALIREMERDDR